MSSRNEQINWKKHESGGNTSGADRSRNRATPNASSVAVSESGDQNSSTEGRGTTAEQIAALKQKVLELERKKEREEAKKREEEQSKMKKELKKATKDIDTLKSQVAMYRRNEKPLREKVEQQQMKIGKLEFDLVASLEQSRTLEEEKSQAEKKASDLEQNLYKCEVELAETKAKASNDEIAFAQKFKELDKDIEEMNETINFLVKRRSSVLLRELNEAKARVEELQKAPPHKRRKEQSSGMEGDVKSEPIDCPSESPAASAHSSTVSSSHQTVHYHMPPAGPNWQPVQQRPAAADPPCSSTSFGSDSPQSQQPHVPYNSPCNSTEAAATGTADAAKLPGLYDDL